MKRSRAGTMAVALAASCGMLLVPDLPSFVMGRPMCEMSHSSTSLRGRDRVTRMALASNVVDAKAKLLDILADESIGREVLKPEGKPTRGKVDEAIVELERLNSESEPVYSQKLDGTWKVKYAGTYAPGLLSSPTRELALFLYGGGFSLGNALSSFAEGIFGQTLGLKVGNKMVKITGGRDVEATANVEAFGIEEVMTYSAELMPLSSSRMSEEITSVKVPSLGKVDLPTELRRSILVTFLDDEVMIVRDESGIPDVLVRHHDAAGPAPAAVSEASSTATNATSTSSEEDDTLMNAMGSEAS